MSEWAQCVNELLLTPLLLLMVVVALSLVPGALMALADACHAWRHSDDDNNNDGENDTTTNTTTNTNTTTTNTTIDAARTKKAHSRNMTAVGAMLCRFRDMPRRTRTLASSLWNGSGHWRTVHAVPELDDDTIVEVACDCYLLDYGQCPEHQFGTIPEEGYIRN